MTLLNPINSPDKDFSSRLVCKIAILFSVLIDLFSSALGQPSTPKFQTFQLVTIQNSSTQFGNNGNPVFRSNPLLANNSIEQQNQQILQQSIMNVPGVTNNIRQQQLAELRQELREERNNEGVSQKTVWSKAYSNKLKELLKMNPDNFSLTKALYLVESAWYNNAPEFSEFEGSVKLWAEVVKKVLSDEGLTKENNTAIMKNFLTSKIFNRSALH